MKKHQGEITISFEMAPKCKTCRLVTTTKVGDDMQITILHHEDGFVYFNLSDLGNQRKDIIAYITEIKPEIQSGVYCAGLIDMDKEEICC